VGNTVFFKHKYLTIPTITKADALNTSIDNLATALKGGIPQPSHTTAAVGSLLNILKKNAEHEKEKENINNSQRARINAAQVQRVLQELEHAKAADQERLQAQRVAAEKTANEANLQVQVPTLEVEYPTTTDTDKNTSGDIPQDDAPPLITQDSSRDIYQEDSPASNTRSKGGGRPMSMTQEAILSTIDISGSAKGITPQQAASRKARASERVC